MMHKILKKWPSILFAVLMVFKLAMPVSAADPLLDGKLTIDRISGNYGSINISAQDAAVISVAGTNYSARNTTYRLTNATSKAAEVSFDYEVTTASSAKINGQAVSGKGSYTVKILAKGYIDIYIAAAKKTTATLSISGLSYTELPDSKVTFTFESAKGSVTVGSAAITSGTTMEVPSGTSLTAAPAANHLFLGWARVSVDSNNKTVYTLESTANPYSIAPSEDMAIHAVFVHNSSDTAWFMIDSKYFSPDLNQATELGSKIVLMNNGTLPAGDYTIPAGDTLLIPCNADNTVYTEEPATTTATTTPSVYRMLTLTSSTSITVNGALCVAGQQSTTQTYNGCPTGPQGFIKMPAKTSITVGNGGKLYAWGYIMRAGSGSEGSVIAESGSAVYECFQVKDWRGGDGTSSMIDNSNKVLPISQYYVQSIEVPLTLNKGSSEYVGMGIHATIPYVNITVSAFARAPFVGNNGLFRMSVDGASITKDYVEETDRLNIDIAGQVTMASFDLNLKSTLFNYSIKSANYVLPLNNSFTVKCLSGSKMTITNDVAVLPGVEIYINSGATVELTSDASIYVYEREEWIHSVSGTTHGHVAAGNKIIIPLAYANGKKFTSPRTADSLVDAKIEIAGTMDATNGWAYTTTGGASVTGKNGGQVTVPLTADSVTYQATQATVDGNQKISYCTIPVVSTMLKNANGEYVETSAEAGTYTYYESTGRWDRPSHYPVDVAQVNPTCTTPGTTAGKKCAVCEQRLDGMDPIPANGHKPGAEATCTTAQTCTVCNAEVVAALGHTFGTVVEANGATCLSAGNVAYKQCTTCKLYFAANAAVNATDGKSDTSSFEIAKKDHSYTGAIRNDGNGKDATHSFQCVNGCGYYGGAVKHTWDAGVVTTNPDCESEGVKTFTCTAENCGATYTATVDALGHDYDAVVTEPTCTEKGYTTYTCQCGHSYVDNYVEALGHSYGEWIVTTAPTCTEAGVETQTCGTCGDTQTHSVDAAGHKYNAVVTAPTCTEKGYTTYTCQCGDSYVDNYVEALGHTKGDDAKTIAATCTEKGSVSYTCTICQTPTVEELDALGGPHDWEGGECSKCTAQFLFKQVNMAVNEGLDLYFYIKKSDVQGLDGQLVCKFTKQYADDRGDKVVEVTDFEEKGDYFRVCFSNIAAKEMKDSITGQILFKDSTKAASYDYSETVFDHIHDLYEQDKKNTAMATVLADLLNYGAACQTLFNYGTENLATKDADTTLMSYATAATEENPPAYSSECYSRGTHLYGTAFSAVNKLMFTFYYDFEQEAVEGSKPTIDPSQFSARVTYTGDDGKTVIREYDTINWFQMRQGDTVVYGLDVDGITLTGGRTTITCELINKDTKVVVSTSVDSIPSYTARAIEAGRDDLGQTMLMLLRAVDSAVAYFN